MRIGAAAAGTALLAAAAPTWAATSATMSVSAQIVAGCAINGAVPASGASVGSLGALDFGSVASLSTAPLRAALTPAATVSLRCTPGVPVTMTVDGGLHYAGGSRGMVLTGGTARIAYALFSDSAYSATIQPGATVSVNVAGSPSPLTLPIFGQATPTGLTSAGLYSDTLTVTLQW
ncbi:spore coat U domain-containing protein [Gluconacetobacter sacchari DSM 12717]|uniref:Spore coat protein U domain-containing protein n=2 Tax=Gluconacetobacter sacchari TaxID=92759 RepID=A0A7W4IDX2_9PROT|nr:spore coat U domain-containing protein [Gluconacetobacter sacchari]MBB2161063.1 spore coat protein U domain-containing protein [Gluconacetobacter sacchari]GBQ26393.1 spore coat U domain-containing protein [Gluconacetobacter sacchari DSM 12717]